MEYWTIFTKKKYVMDYFNYFVVSDLFLMNIQTCELKYELHSLSDLWLFHFIAPQLLFLKHT